MPSGSECLRHVCLTLRACNGSLVRRNFHNLATSFFRFVYEISGESSPRSIIDVLGEVWMPYHAFDIQIFDDNAPISLNKESRELMQEVCSLICDKFMQLTNIEFRISSICRALDLFAQSPLQDFQTPFRCNEIAGVLKLNSIGEGSKTFKPDINADFVVGEFMFLRLNRKLATENSEPFARRSSLDSKRLDFALNGSVQNGFDISNFGEMKSVIFDNKPVLWIRDAFISSERLEAGKSDLTFPFFYPPEEVLKSLVNSVGNILQGLAVNAFEFRMLPLQLNDVIVQIEFTKRLLAVLVGFDSGFKKLVVEKTHDRKILFKDSNVLRSRIQTVFEHPLCRKHMIYMLQKNLKAMVESQFIHQIN